MKTITYAEIINRACEAAGRTRDKLPASEATLLKSVLAFELRKIWHAADWPELVPAIASQTVASNAFSKGEGTEDEIGDVIGVYTADPRTTTIYEEVEWDEGDNTVRLHPTEYCRAIPDTVYAEYMLPCPDLLEVAADDLDDYEIPRRFASWLAARAAGHLLTADGQPALAGVQFGLAESYLADELARVTRPPWRMRLRVRR